MKKEQAQMRIIIVFGILFSAYDLHALWLIDTPQHPVSREQIYLNSNNTFFTMRDKSNTKIKHLVAVSPCALLSIGKKEPNYSTGQMSVNGKDITYKLISKSRKGYCFHLYIFDQDITKSQVKLRAVYNNDTFNQLRVLSPYGGRVVTNSQPRLNLWDFHHDLPYKDFLALVKEKHATHFADLKGCFKPKKKQSSCYLEVPQEQFQLTKSDTGTILLDNEDRLIAFALPTENDPTDPKIDLKPIDAILKQSKPAAFTIFGHHPPRHIAAMARGWKMCHPYTKHFFTAEMLLTSYAFSKIPMFTQYNAYYCAIPALAFFTTTRMNTYLNRSIGRFTPFSTIDEYYKMRHAYQLYCQQCAPHNQSILEKAQNYTFEKARFFCITPAVAEWILEELANEMK